MTRREEVHGCRQEDGVGRCNVTLTLTKEKTERSVAWDEVFYIKHVERSYVIRPRRSQTA